MEYERFDKTGPYTSKQVREQNGELALLGKLARCNYTEEQLLHIEADAQNNAFKKLVRGFEKGIL